MASRKPQVYRNRNLQIRQRQEAAVVEARRKRRAKSEQILAPYTAGDVSSSLTSGTWDIESIAR